MTDYNIFKNKNFYVTLPNLQDGESVFLGYLKGVGLFDASDWESEYLRKDYMNDDAEIIYAKFYYNFDFKLVFFKQFSKRDLKIFKKLCRWLPSLCCNLHPKLYLEKKANKYIVCLP